MYDARHPKLVSERIQRDGVRREVGVEFRMTGTHVYLWPIHADVWQKPPPYCKVVILQLKNNF